MATCSGISHEGGPGVSLQNGVQLALDTCLTTTATVGHKNHGVSTLPFGVPRGLKGLRCLVTSVNVHWGDSLSSRLDCGIFLHSLLCLGKLQEGRQRGLEDPSDEGFPSLRLPRRTQVSELP